MRIIHGSCLLPEHTAPGTRHKGATFLPYPGPVLALQEQLDCQELRLSRPVWFGSLSAARGALQSKPGHAPPGPPRPLPDAPLIGRAAAGGRAQLGSLRQ